MNYILLKKKKNNNTKTNKKQYRKLTLQWLVMHQSFVTIARRPPPHPPPTGMGGDSRTNVRGNDNLSSPAVSGKCQACAIAQIYPRGNYCYKVWGYDCQEVPAVQGF